MTRADTDLLAAAARGDDAAFDDLVRRHTTRMYRIALRIVGDPAEAEDVVQDAWVSAWRGLAKFRGEAAPTTWLFRVVTNTALAHLRKRRPTVPLEGTAEPVMTDVAADPERAALRNEQTDLVLRAIATLEPSQRVPLVLRELEELSYEEVAEVLDVPVPTLRSRLYRARVALLAKLEELR
ncbi:MULTISPECIES: sigma-70 family RNA polymerase sigma factor [unclassified Crossiella]|uniref:RNA polymerase sigma factor n=1 Tax=unclassified Crossiella TaxID=2620835 RepID=UPI001FFEE361|nr:MULTISPECIES: sigma-70 family RNA polymerase sigma factor [unclassified Crossiella]MCK2240496.1 sigma-70 family RNA polymerase sigma factor [Crossiella sp. S99.2]MCK2253053.1 sigma-70 family RNA polymerase sigma factor [Crossiella sp. S99.1]